ncbi:MAG: DUF3147 family protein [Opitutales bacterium]
MAKRTDKIGALIASLPFVTIMVMVWLFVEKQGTEKIANHAYYTLWYVIPTLPMFALIPWVLRRGIHFWWTMAAAIALTFVCFLITVWVGKKNRRRADALSPPEIGGAVALVFGRWISHAVFVPEVEGEEISFVPA